VSSRAVGLHRARHAAASSSTASASAISRTVSRRVGPGLTIAATREASLMARVHRLPRNISAVGLASATPWLPAADDRLGARISGARDRSASPGMTGRRAQRAPGPQREAVELAFVAALQHLPGNQRAALVLFEVLGYSAAEIAEEMATTTASVNSALQRARKIVAREGPVATQQTTLRAIDDARLRRIVDGYSTALERGDAEALVALLTEDVTWSMPPLPHWYRGCAAVMDFAAAVPLGSCGAWRHLATGANGQPAVAAYLDGAGSGVHRAYRRGTHPEALARDRLRPAPVAFTDAAVVDGLVAQPSPAVPGGGVTDWISIPPTTAMTTSQADTRRPRERARREPGPRRPLRGALGRACPKCALPLEQVVDARHAESGRSPSPCAPGPAGPRRFGRGVVWLRMRGCPTCA